MASAWGLSWGLSWGVSWGAAVTPPAAPSGGGWFQPQKKREAAKLLQDRQKRAMEVCMLAYGAGIT